MGLYDFFLVSAILEACCIAEQSVQLQRAYREVPPTYVDPYFVEYPRRLYWEGPYPRPYGYGHPYAYGHRRHAVSVGAPRHGEAPPAQKMRL